MSNLLELKDENENPTTYNTDIDHEPDPEESARVKGGANWFYWIAGLSLINSVIFASGGNLSFVAGLGFTQLAEAIIELSIQQGAPAALKAVAIIFSIIFVVIFALVGYFANKRFASAFMIGIVVYVVDAVVLLALGELLPAGFHAFALFFIIRGFLACRKLNAFDTNSMKQISEVPPPPSFG